VIRRLHNNREFWLFPQADNARVAAELARVAGGGKLIAPAHRTSLERALALHEAGWADTDAAPSLNAQKLPQDALDAHWATSLAAWARAVQIVREQHPDDLIAHLLVSIHGLQQSYDVGKPTERASRFDPQEMRKYFEANKFQHREIELQEAIRAELGMAVDQPRRLGLAVDVLPDVREKSLTNDYRWMQMLDLLSLSLFATDVMAAPIGPIYDSAGQLQTFRLARVDALSMTVAPWCFDVPGPIRVQASYRRYPALPTRSVPEFQHAMASIEPTVAEFIIKSA
jgi:hypothetical protein